jgi:hypothetical protein
MSSLTRGRHQRHNVIRDSKLQSYHQLTYAGPSYP